MVSSTPDNLRWIDEVGIIGETSIVGVRGGEPGQTLRLALADQLGIGPYTQADIASEDTADEQARIVVEVLAGRAPQALIDFVAVNAATLIYLGATGHTVLTAFELAREVLSSGAALDKLRDLVLLTGGTDVALRRWS